MPVTFLSGIRKENLGKEAPNRIGLKNGAFGIASPSSFKYEKISDEDKCKDKDLDEPTTADTMMAAYWWVTPSSDTASANTKPINIRDDVHAAEVTCLVNTRALKQGEILHYKKSVPRKPSSAQAETKKQRIA